MIVQSQLLSQFPELRCGVSTRQGGVSPEPYGMNLSFKVGDAEANVKKNRESFLGQLGIELDSLAMPQQVHGDTITSVNAPGQYDQCDALITNKAGVFLVVTVADCLPVFLFDPMARSIAAVHVGWRGSKLRTLEKAMRALSNEYGTESEHLLAYIGPSAGVCCYEVGEEVAQEFPKQFLERMNNAKPRLDLKGFNKNLLLENSVKESSIEVSGYCTICKPKLFHSYRRDGKSSGRMMGVIGMMK